MEDNQGAIAISKNPVAYARMKHIDIRFHYNIHEAVQDGTFTLQYYPTKDMIADILTKPLSKGQFETLQDALGIKELDFVQHEIKWGYCIIEIILL